MSIPTPDKILPLAALGWRKKPMPGITTRADLRILADHQYGGDATDRRMVLSVEELEKMMEVAKASPTKRLVLHQVGVRVQLVEHVESGHRYEVVKLVAGELKAEQSPMGFMS